METIDLHKKWKSLYAPSSKAVELVDVPAFKFVMIDGRIESGSEPGLSPGFAEAMGALYGAAYTLKFTAKKQGVDPFDYPVMPLEGLWWVEDGRFDIQVKDNWVYRLMIMQPDQVTQAMFEDALAQLEKKRPNPALPRLRLESFTEGLSVQIMHIGPYGDEPATVAKMEAWAAANGYRMAGNHHEIYLGDPRRADPSKLKTVLRHPVERA